MKNKLQQLFPMIKTREEIHKTIYDTPKLLSTFSSWKAEQQEEFLSFVTGASGVKMLYDSFFKEIFNPETVPERLNQLLSLLLGKNVQILEILPPDNSRLADETSLVIMDIVVKLEDGSTVDIEVQKIGYLFQDSAAPVTLLQKYVFIPLDIFSKSLQNKGINNDLDAWLAFLSSDNPEIIAALTEYAPVFKDMYRHLYEICENVEGVMNMFSKELQILDRNTVQLMIDEMQDDITQLTASNIKKDNIIAARDNTIAECNNTIAELKAQLAQYQNPNDKK